MRRLFGTIDDCRRTAVPDPAGRGGETRRVRVWDLPTRLFHWLVVGLVVAAYATWRANWMDWHARVGDALLTLLLWRLVWGFIGSDTARFARFLARPGAALRHLAHLLRRDPDRSVGHNPAGGWMVVVLLVLLFGQVLTGIYVNNDVADVGPLTETMPAPFDNAMTALHALLWQALLAAIALHVLAILVYAVAKGHNLVLPMITGSKRLSAAAPAPRMAPPMRALAALVIAAAAAAAIADLL